MKIFYLTGTGNSLWAARTISEKFENCEIININKYNNEVVSDDVIGFVFPCYCLTSPIIVRDFISKLKFTSKKSYIFAIVTHNTVPGRALLSVDKVLKKKGLNLSYGNDIEMPGNSLIIKDYMNPLEERERRLNNAGNTINGIIDDIKDGNKVSTYPNIPVKVRIRTTLEYFALDKFYLPRAFNTDNKCNGCGTCAKVCSVRNIEIVNKSVEWGKNCHACLACFHWCPSKSIQIGNYTEDKERIHHPGISLNEIVTR